MHELCPGSLVRKSLASFIRQTHPEWESTHYVCVDDLDRFRVEYIESLIRDESGALTRLDEEVIESFRENELITENVNKQFEAEMTFGEEIADKVASFGGSWTFILLFAFVLVGWMTVNVTAFLTEVFDPYPFILLNLVLSCLAAIQAPVIMMSQNRQAKKQVIKADFEYMINLKAELQVRQLNSKMDHLMREQWDRMLEIQNCQIDLLDQVNSRLKG